MPSVIALNCSLKSSPTLSSTDKLVNELLAALEQQGCDTRPDIVRVADLNILPGVTSDEGPGDDWPNLRKDILASDILVLGTPIWLGQPSSIAKRVLERMDAFFGETDDEGRLVSFGRVAVVAVVGNEDGAHHVGAELFQALSDVGFTIPASGMTYWVGEAMGGTDYKDLAQSPDKVRQNTQRVAVNAAHLARFLSQNNYPPTGD